MAKDISEEFKGDEADGLLGLAFVSCIRLAGRCGVLTKVCPEELYQHGPSKTSQDSSG